MSAISQLVASLKAPAKPTLPPNPVSTGAVQNANLPPATQTWNGQQIPASIATKNLIAYDPTTGNKTFNLGNAGAGVYTEDKNGNIVNTGHTSYGGEPAVAGSERDDIIPVSLGGANSNPNNIQTIPMSKAAPQDKVETATAQAVKSGAIQPKAAISQILSQKQQIAGQAPSTNASAYALPAIRDALGDVLVKPEQKLIADAGTRIAQAGTRAVEPLLSADIQQNIDTNMQKNQHILGVDVAPLGTGTEAAKQIGAQALNAAAGIGNIAMAENPEATVKGIGSAFKSGAEALGIGSKAATEAATTGAETANAGTEAVKSALPEAKPTETPKSLKDVTPEYDSKTMAASDKITNPEGKTQYRLNPPGKLGSTTVNPNISEFQAAQEVDKIPDYEKAKTFTAKSQAVDTAISNEAENMRTSIQAEDKANPLNAETEKAKMIQMTHDNLPEDIQAKVDAGKSLPKTKAGEYYQKTLDNANAYDGTREGKLDVRQSNDQAYQSARGKYAFGDENLNALDDSNHGLRNSINKDLADTSEQTNTPTSLKKQTNLYNARDILDNKAKAEATFGQRHPFIKALGGREARMILGTGAATILLGGSVSSQAGKVVKAIGGEYNKLTHHTTLPKPKTTKPKALPKLKL